MDNITECEPMENNDGNFTTPSFEVYEYVNGVGVPSLAIVAVIFNAFTLFVMCTQCGHLKSHYVLIVVQCSADLLASLCSLVFYLIPNGFNPLSMRMRVVYHYCVFRCVADLLTAAFVLSLLNLLAMTMDRLLAVHLPLRYAVIARTSRVKSVAVTIAGVSFIVACVPVVTTTILRSPNNASFCCDYHDSMYFGVHIGTFLIAMDTLVMFVVYSYILHQVRNSVRMHDNMASMYRTTMTSLWIITTFMLCYWPDVISNHVDFPIPIHFSIKALPLVNCILDPVIYAIRLRKIRKGFRKLYYKICFSRESALRLSTSESGTTKIVMSIYAGKS